MSRTRSTALGLGIVALVVLSVFFTARSGEEPLAPPLEPRSAPGPSQEPALAGVPPDASRDGLVVPRPPPGGTVVRFLERETRRPIAGAGWRVHAADGSTVAEGVAGAEGLSVLAAEVVDSWASVGALRVWAEGRLDDRVPLPRGTREREIEILLSSDAAEFAGVVLDESGRPVPGAGVVLQRWDSSMSTLDAARDFERATTDEAGRWRLTSKSLYPDAPFMEGHDVWAGAPGFRPAHAKPEAAGRSAVVLTLHRDLDGGVLEVHARLPDGSPAAGADVWVEAVPSDLAALRFAEIWRRPGDDRDSGYRTWEHLGERRIWKGRLDAEGRFTFHPVPPGVRRVQVRSAAGSADERVQVGPPPTPTTARLSVQPFRVVTGSLRVARDPDWHCDHEAHEHRIRYEDWPEPYQVRSVPDGPFRLDDVPVSAPGIEIATRGHPGLTLALASAREVHLGELVVPSARELEVQLRWPSGEEPEPWSGVILEDGDGIVAQATTYYTTGGGPYARLVMTRRPGRDARVLVRPRLSGEDTSRLLRLEGPFDLVSGARLELRLPEGTPGRQD